MFLLVFNHLKIRVVVLLLPYNQLLMPTEGAGPLTQWLHVWMEWMNQTLALDTAF